MEPTERDPDERREPVPDAEPKIEDNEDKDEPPQWDEKDEAAHRERPAEQQDEHPEW